MIDAGGGKNSFEFIKNELAKNNLKKPDYIVLTHHHWDHTFGINYFNSFVISSVYTKFVLDYINSIDKKTTKDIISDSLEPKFCIEHINLEYHNDLSKLDNLIVNKTVSNLSLDLGNRIVDIKEVQANHTKGSLVIFDRLTKTIFIGDADCGVIKGYDFVLDKNELKKFIKDISVFDYSYIVRGHGEVVDKETYLSSLE